MKGVVVIFVCKLGNVIETSSCFDSQSFGGFSLKESQKIRVKKSIIERVVNGYCSSNLTDNISTSTYERIFSDLIQNGAKLHYHYIGHEND
jgi:hypothetical protein